MYPSAYFSPQPNYNSQFLNICKKASTDKQTNKQTETYCKILQHNTNAMNFCTQNKCYMVNPNAPWIKTKVKWQDNADFSINNRISENTSYFGGEFNRLHYSLYTPFQYDPTWEEYKFPKRFKPL